MHIPGLLGMPRRIYTLRARRGWDTLTSCDHRRFVQAIATPGCSCKSNRFLFQRKGKRETIHGMLDSGMVDQFGRHLRTTLLRFRELPAGDRCGTSNIQKIPDSRYE